MKNEEKWLKAAERYETEAHPDFEPKLKQISDEGPIPSLDTFMTSSEGKAMMTLLKTSGREIELVRWECRNMLQEHFLNHIGFWSRFGVVDWHRMQQFPKTPKVERVKRSAIISDILENADTNYLDDMAEYENPYDHTEELLVLYLRKKCNEIAEDIL